MVIDETYLCVENIKKNFGKKDIKIIIVDNKSPNNSGIELKKKYVNDNNVKVLLNYENSGFAKGNNIGYCYAVKQYNPDYIIIINNDIQIIQKNFLENIQKLYLKENFAVLGPDVFSSTLKIHQSPKRLKAFSEDEIHKNIISYKKKCRSKLTVRVKCCFKHIKPLKQIIYNNRIKNNHIDYKKTYYNIILHGSCFIFSKIFMNKRDKAFFDGTFMYFESEILDYECHRDGLKTMYSPEIQVIHNHNIATNAAFKSDLQRTMFMNKCIYNSLIAFDQLIKRDKGIT